MLEEELVEFLGRRKTEMIKPVDVTIEHWVHLRTTKVVESPFNSGRLKTDAAKRFKKVQKATARY